LKKKKITYNKNGLKRTENVSPKTSIPKVDLNCKNLIIHKNNDSYWRIEKKK
jgi:hypothetical protein